PVSGGAGYHAVPHLAGAGAGEGAAEEVGNVLNGGGQGDRFEDRAGDKGGGEGTVEVDAVIGSVALLDVRGGLWVKGGGGKETEDLAGPVVIDGHRPLFPIHSGVGLIVEPGVNGEVEVIARPHGAVGPGEEMIARELVGEGHQGS